MARPRGARDKQPRKKRVYGVWFDGRRTAIVRSAESRGQAISLARKAKRRGGDRVVSARPLKGASLRAAQAGRWTRERARPGDDTKLRGFGPKPKGFSDDMPTLAEFRRGRGPDRRPRKRRGLGIAAASLGGGAGAGAITGGLIARGGLGNNAGLIKSAKIMGREQASRRRPTATRRQGIKGSPRHAFGRSQELRDLKLLQGQKRAYQGLSPLGVKRELAGKVPVKAQQLKSAELHKQLSGMTKARIRGGVGKGAVVGTLAAGTAVGIGYGVSRWRRRSK